MYHIITESQVESYRLHLQQEERSPGTIAKYSRDLKAFFNTLPPEKQVSKEIAIQWKQEISQRYAVNTVNSMLAAVNGFFQYQGWQECRVKPLKQQKQIFRDTSRELTKRDYLCLMKTAYSKGNHRLYYLMETLSATGIRISELQYITVESLKTGQATVDCKGKRRTILLIPKLRQALCAYCKEQDLISGPVFVTRSGRPMDRSNIWRELQQLCADAGVTASKVYPHNFRHLFARAFYDLEKDIAKLADLLGHASIETTRIYIMESGAQHEQQVERLGFVV